MSTAFTPGPWRAVMGISQMVDYGTTIYHRGIWGVYTDAQQHGDDEADACLIAAALDLLRELQFASQFVLAGGGKSVDLDRIAALIERAGGEQ